MNPVVDKAADLVAEALRHVEQQLGEGRMCHAASWALHDVLEYYGVGSTVVPVETLIVNPAAEYCSTCGNPPNTPKNADTISAKPMTMPGLSATDFHSVVFVDGLMIDLTAGQFARPQHGVNVPAQICAEMDEAMLDSTVAFTFGDALMQYSRLPVEAKVAYKGMWRGKGSITYQITAAVIREMKRHKTDNND